MGNHPTTVEGYAGSLEQLAKAIGNMTYDQTGSFIEKLADDLKKQADSDLVRGRKKLAETMYKVIEQLYAAKTKMDQAWKICEPYTNK